MSEDSYNKTIKKAARLIAEAERPVRVLRHLVWPLSVKQEFLRSNGARLPDVRYPAFDAAPVFQRLDEARRAFGRDLSHCGWLYRAIDGIDSGARLLATRASPQFYTWSQRIYGSPASCVLNQETTALELARHLSRISPSRIVETEKPQEPNYTAAAAGEVIFEAVKRQFGDLAPTVVLDDSIAANAISGPRRIRLNANACFSPKYIDQLVQHEALVHVATFLNGSAQTCLPLLASGHPGITQTQEGLAVFAELMSSTMDVLRFRRLADRVIAIDMAIQGADFIQVWRYFQDQGDSPAAAFDHAQRIFRGGVLSGGAPFTKDVVYLEGLLRVQDFFAAAIAAGKTDALQILFCGKIEIQDVPDMAALMKTGLCVKPKFLPPWAQDIDRLHCLFSYTNFLNGVAMGAVRNHHLELLRCAGN